jgi:hypothetical protein
MAKWEYMVKTLNADLAMSLLPLFPLSAIDRLHEPKLTVLNYYGKEGWELAAIESREGGDPVAYFKKRTSA